MISVALDFDAGVARLAMLDGGKFNADSLRAFDDALGEALDHEETEVLVITGEGKHFSQGLDLDYLMAVGDPDAAMAHVLNCMRMIGRLLSAPVPVVAAVNGHAFGLGAMITLAADYKAMREDRGYFCLPEADLGMTLTGRMNVLVCNKLSGSTLRDALLCARRFTAAEAQTAGIVDIAVPLDSLEQAAIALAGPMRGKQRQALAGLKRGMNSAILQAIESETPEVTLQ